MADTTIKRLRTNALLTRYSDGYGYSDSEAVKVDPHQVPGVTAAVAGPVGSVRTDTNWRPSGLYVPNPESMYFVGSRDSNFGSWSRRGLYHVSDIDQLDSSLEPVLKAGVTHDTPGAIINMVWTMRDGSAIFTFFPSEGPRQVWYGNFDANGDFQAHHLITLPDGGNLAVGHGSAYQAPHGTVCIAEYGDDPGGRKIYRAASPAGPFTEVFSLDYDRHFHGVHYHAGTGRWITTRGDGDNSGAFYSDDDGVNWQVLPGHEQGATSFQDVGLLDIGDPEWLITGSDSSAGVNRLNMLTGEHEQLWFDADGRNNKTYVFSLARHKGVTYGSTVDYTGSDRNNVIVASRDHKKWSVIYRFGDSSETMIAGVFNDQLMTTANIGGGDVPLIVVDTVDIYNVDGIVLDGGYKNELSEQASSFEVDSDLTGWSTDNRDGIVDGGYHGTKALKYSNNGDITIESPIVTVNNGDVVTGSVVMRGNSQKTTVGQLRIDGSTVGTSFNFGPLRDDQRIMNFWPYTAPADNTDIRFTITVQGDDCQAYIDAAQLVVNGVAHTWVPGQVDRPGDKYNAMVNAGLAWTNIFCTRPGLMAQFLAAAGDEIEIRRWLADDSNYARLYWDTTDNKFKLERVLSGTPRTIIATEATHFYRNAHIWFAVRRDENEITLSVANGDDFEHSSNMVIGPLGSNMIQVRYGDGTAMPMDLLHDWWFNEFKADVSLGGVIEQYIGLPAVDISESEVSVSSFDEQALDQFREVLQLEQQRLVEAAKVTLNRAVQDKQTGEIVYYDDDGQTPLVRHMPADSGAKITRQVV